MSRDTRKTDEAEFDDYAEDGGPRQPPFVEALVGAAIRRGGDEIQSRVRRATGALDPHVLKLNGFVESVPEPGIVELRVAVAGAKPQLIRIPFAGGVVAQQQSHLVEKLVGNRVQMTIQVERC